MIDMKREENAKFSATADLQIYGAVALLNDDSLASKSPTRVIPGNSLARC